MLAAGTYRVTMEHPTCWTDFTLSESGAVVFTDAGDGHKSYWSATPEWLTSMAQMLAEGRLVRVSP